MCEIFPEVETCCLVIELRLGMVFIAVFSIMTGALGLIIVEQKTNASFNNLKNVTDIDEPKEVISGLNTIIPSGITACSALFIICGIFLLMGNLWHQEGLIQLFVWFTFLNVLVGYILIVMVAFECISLEGCLIGGMDWLTGAVFLVASFFYLSLWIYFIIVANSFVYTMVT